MPLVETTVDFPTPDPSAATPELVVSVYAHNSASHIRKTIAGILDQEGVRLEVTVIDDGSTDDTSTVVKAVMDSRVTLLRNEQPQGSVASLFSVMSGSRTPFVAQVNAGDLVLPGALERLLHLCRSAARIGMVHCYSFVIDQNGETTREAFRLRRAQLLQNQTLPTNGLHGKRIGIDSVRLYRREVLEQVFTAVHEPKSVSTNELDLLLSQVGEIKLLPEFLYARRVTESSEPATPGPRLRNRLADAVSFTKRIRSARDKIVGAAYRTLATHLSWWPIGSALAKTRPKGAGRKIAYYIWHFPVLSQTFVNRELAALKEAGLSIEIVADGAESLELADANAKLLLQDTHYLDPPSQGMLRKQGKRFFRENPLLFLNLLLFVITRRHDAHKSLQHDLYLLARASHLAQVLRERDIDHIHAPWADQTAFIALIAAKLCGITYSVQARAHDIHRKSYLYGLREKFENAEFVVTNTRYNQIYIRSLIDERHHEKIELIYNGIDLDKFTPRLEAPTHSRPIRLLCVARLIEQKGFPYLLEALALLKEKGFNFRCEVVGGPEQPRYTDYLVQVKKLHRRLGLVELVEFLGPQPFRAVMEKYAAADIFVLPCVIARDGSRDITPNSLIEAMAMELPVISTNVTGVPEIVENGVSGLLIQPNNVDELVEGLERLIQDPKLREKLGKAARKRVEERFDIKRNVAKRLDLFGEVFGLK